jgi:hypothetical protein
MLIGVLGAGVAAEPGIKPTETIPLELFQVGNDGMLAISIGKNINESRTGRAQNLRLPLVA